MRQAQRDILGHEILLTLIDFVMKKFYYLVSVLAFTAMVGCQNENEVLGIQQESDVVFTASFEGNASSRTQLEQESEKLKTVWSKTDQLSIFAGKCTNRLYKLTDGEGQTNATFEFVQVSGGIEDNSSSATTLSANVAYYPYNQNVTVASGTTDGSYTINAVFPAEQTYTESLSFGEGAAPMVAVTESELDTDLSFKNVGGILGVGVTGSATISKIKFTAENKTLAGPVAITATKAEPYATFAANEGVSSITLNCGAVTLTNNPTWFMVAMLPVAIESGKLTITIYDTEGKYMTYSHETAVNLTRSGSVKIENVAYSGELTAGVDEANAQLKSGDTDVTVDVSSTNASESAASIQLPENDSENPTNLTFSAITEGTTVSIAATDDSNGGEAKEVNVSVPSSTTGYNFNIDLPNSTVTLGANGTSATYNEVTASTAENTLIVGDGVTVKTLKIKKGHVRVHGKIESVIREGNENGTTTYIILEDGAEIPSNLGEGFVVVSAADYGFIQFLNSAASGDSYTLTGNVTVPANTEIPEGVAVDGANYSVLTSVTGTDGVGKGVFKLSANSAIKNLTFTSPGTQYDVIVEGAATIENCKFPTPTASTLVNANGAQYGKRAIYTASAAVSGELNVVSCTFDNYVYAFNFSSSTNTMDITFTGCAMKGWLSGNGNSHKFVNCIFGKSDDYQNYVPYCPVTFEGCTFLEGFTISLKHVSTLTFDNSCKVGSTAITEPSDLTWDFSGDGTDEGQARTVTIGSSSWTYSSTEGESYGWKDAFLAFLESAESGDSYTLVGDVTVPAGTEIPAGVTVEGAGYSVTTTIAESENGVGKGVFVLNKKAAIKNLTFTSPLTQYDVIVKGDATIEGCVFSTATASEMNKGKRAIYTGSESLEGDLSVTSCTFDDKVYAFNFSNPANQMDITFKECTMKGWLSGHGKSHKFVNCNFGASGDYKNYIPYCDASFEGCTFLNNFVISLKHAGALTFDSSCKVGSTTIDEPSDLTWDFSGDGSDNATPETVTIGGSSWTNDGTESASWSSSETTTTGEE